MSIVLSHTYAWPEVRRGGERYLHELSAALSDAGHHVVVLATSDSPRTEEVLGVPVHYFRRGGRGLGRFGESAPEVAFAGRAAAWTAGRKIDVWHALGAPDAAAAALLGRLRRFRSVYTALGVPVRSYHESRNDRRLHEIVVRHVDDYICYSETAARALTEGWGRRPVVVGGGVDTRRFVPVGSRSDRPVLVYSGALDAPHKNLPLLIDAMSFLIERVPGIELWLSGPGRSDRLLDGASSRVRAAVRPLGIASGDDEAARRYSSAWATVLPSENESFGMVVVESLACGTPAVVLETSGGPAEIVRPGTGVLARKSPESLASACEMALEMAGRPTIVDECRAAAEEHDWRKRIVPRLEQIYGG